MSYSIQNIERAVQKLDFRLLPVGATDIDGFIEWNDELFIFFDAKLSGTQLSGGQRLAFERIIDNLTKPAIFFVIYHKTYRSEVIDAGNCMVVRYYWKGKWRIPSEVISLRKCVEGFINGISQRTVK